jgi:hypothetical protein
MRVRHALALTTLTLSGVGVAVAGIAAPAIAGPPSVRQLTGTLALVSGSCAGGHPSGSYLSVTFGTRAIRNSASNCDKGAVTLLGAGHGGLSTQQFSPVSDLTFDGHGDARSDTITAPARFGRHTFGVVTAAQNLQDAPRGGQAFALPRIYLIGNKVHADLRSVQILYDGVAGSSCASASGYGCWLVGAEQATGTYNASTREMTLSWFSGQSFTPASAGTTIHLQGRFVGAPHRVAKGTTVDLGTASFAAGPVHAESAAAQSSGNRTAVSQRGGRHHGGGRRHHKGRLAADSPSTSTGSPRTFLIAEILVMLNLVAFFVLARRRSDK